MESFVTLVFFRLHIPGHLSTNSRRDRVYPHAMPANVTDGQKQRFSAET
jgi:hypothetical protein